jgi:transcriptional regulator with XRE-family HTH domain
MPTISTAQRVAAEVRAEMARQRKTQAHIAQALGSSQAAVSRRLNGEVPFDVRELALIADSLDVPVETFLSTSRGAA